MGRACIRMGEIRNAYNILVGNPEKERHTCRDHRRLHEILRDEAPYLV
jgi:hypothetical protein